MSDEKDDGGPAFPSGEYTDGFREDQTPVKLPRNVGMSLRDYFAGQALIAVLQSGYNYDKVTEHCYKIADAMLKARQQ